MAVDDDLMAELLPRLSQLNGVMSRGGLVERGMRATGLSLERPAISVLTALKMADEPLRIGEIATRMQVAGPHATRQVQALEQRRLVHRVADPVDQRASLIELTAEGRAAAENYFRYMFGSFAEAMADWPRQDQQDLIRLLGRLVEDLSAHLTAAERPDHQPD